MTPHIRQRPVRLLVGLLALAISTVAVWLAAAATPTALAKTGATIVVGQSIDGIKLGMTASQLKRAHGAPASTRIVSGVEADWQYGTNPIGVLVTLNHGQVTGLWTPRKEYKTNKGIGVGSSPSQVKHAYPQAKCTPGKGPGGTASSLVCVIKSGHDKTAVETSIEWRDQTAGAEEIAIERV